MSQNEKIELSERRREFRKLARRIEKIIKDEIRRQDLIQTGNMLRSIQCKVSEGSMQQMDVNIDAVDYFKYVNGNFNVVRNAFNTAEYQAVLIDFRRFINKYYR